MEQKVMFHPILHVCRSAIWVILAVTSSTATAPSSQPYREKDAIQAGYDMLRYEFYYDLKGGECKPIPMAIRDFYRAAKSNISQAIRDCETDLASARKDTSLRPPDRLTKVRMYQEELNQLRRTKVARYLVAPPLRAYPPIGSLAIGRYGVIQNFKVRQVIDKSNAIIASRQGDVCWIEGLSTDTLIDGSSYAARIPARVTGTKQYATVGGSSNTIPLLTVVQIETYADGITLAQFEALLAERGIERAWLSGVMEAAQKANRLDPGMDVAKWVWQRPAKNAKRSEQHKRDGPRL
jgi:hypothetical protein